MGTFFSHEQRSQKPSQRRQERHDQPPLYVSAPRPYTRQYESQYHSYNDVHADEPFPSATTRVVFADYSNYEPGVYAALNVGTLSVQELYYEQEAAAARLFGVRSERTHRPSQERAKHQAGRYVRRRGSPVSREMRAHLLLGASLLERLAGASSAFDGVLPSGSFHRRTTVEGSDVDLICVLNSEWAVQHDAAQILSHVRLSVLGKPRGSHLEPGLDGEQQELVYEHELVWPNRGHEARFLFSVRHQSHSLGVQVHQLTPDEGDGRRRFIYIKVCDVDLVPMVRQDAQAHDEAGTVRLGLIKNKLGVYKGEKYGELQRRLRVLSRPGEYGTNVRTIIRALKRFKKSSRSTGLSLLSSYSIETAVIDFFQHKAPDHKLRTPPEDPEAAADEQLFEWFWGCIGYVWQTIVDKGNRPPNSHGMSWRDVGSRVYSECFDWVEALYKNPLAVEYMFGV